MLLGGVGWDKKEFPETNLHVCGTDDTKILIYSKGRCTKEKNQGGNQAIFRIRL